MTEHSEAAPTRRDNGGDAFRAKLTDLDWIRDSGAVELRHALHALCWRMQRETVDGFCTDPQVAHKVLIAARGVNAELRSRAELLADGNDDLTSMRRRISSSEAVILSCQIALDLHQQQRTDALGTTAAAVLARAIAAHRLALHSEPREADTVLWRSLDEVERGGNPATRMPEYPIAPMPAMPMTPLAPTQSADISRAHADSPRPVDGRLSRSVA